MRKGFFLSIIALGLVFTGCEKEKSDDGRLPNTLCIQVTQDVESEYDSIVVLDSEYKGSAFETYEKTFYKSVYFSTTWTGGRPAYGFCLSGKKTPAVGSDKTISLNLPENQESGQNYEMMAGKVLEENGDFKVNLHDARSFIRVAMDVDIIASVKLSAPGGEMICGDIKVHIDSLSNDSTNFWVADKAGQMYSSLQLVPGGDDIKDGCFKPGTYDIALLPQFYSKGLKVTMYDKDGKPACTKTLGATDGYEMKRNDMDVVEYDDDTMPDVIKIVLDFYNEDNINPLGTFPAVSKQNSTTGETYNVKYEWEFEGEIFSEDIPIVVCKGTVASGEYKYFAPSSMVYGEVGRKILNFVKENWWIKLPAIKGRYLKSVTVSHGNNYNKRCFIYTGPGTGQVCSYTSNSSQAIATADHLNVETMSFPNELEYAAVHKTQINTPYYLYGKGAAGIRIYKLEITYSKTL